MSNRLHIQGDYTEDWDEVADRARAEAGHRCVRCGHPYETGKHGKGEWTPCDEHCRHMGPLGILNDGGEARMIPNLHAQSARKFHSGKTVVARWRILTVHHLDGNKSNNAWWNILPLCQRCHLQIQTRLNPQIPWFLEHSSWFKPYVAGFYAKKYEGRDITREQAVAEMDRLLAHERLT